MKRQKRLEVVYKKGLGWGQKRALISPLVGFFFLRMYYFYEFLKEHERKNKKTSAKTTVWEKFEWPPSDTLPSLRQVLGIDLTDKILGLKL